MHANLRSAFETVFLGTVRAMRVIASTSAAPVRGNVGPARYHSALP
jgi:hypothetical protein